MSIEGDSAINWPLTLIFNFFTCSVPTPIEQIYLDA
jgi:hypothetical protein